MRTTLYVTRCLAALVWLAPAAALAQTPASIQRPLFLAEARDLARQHSPDLASSRQAVAAAAGRARQAGAWLNPTLSYTVEVTSGDGESDSQGIVRLDQPIEIGGQRGARQEAASLTLAAAEYRVAAAEGRLDFEVTRTYATVAAAGRRAQLAEEAAAIFARAVHASEARLDAGDVSGYQHRRLALEAARYGAAALTARLARDSSLNLLAAMVGIPDSAERLRSISFADLPAPRPIAGPLDSLVQRALAGRPELLAAQSEAAARTAEVRLASAVRIPTLTFSGGYKRQDINTSVLEGFVAGVSVPLPLWDRNGGAVSAARAEEARGASDMESIRRGTRQEVVAAYESQQAIGGALTLLSPQLGDNAVKARRAAEVAYGEGEIGLLEWLDAVRAFEEAEATYATMVAEYITRRAALERAVGATLF